MEQARRYVSFGAVISAFRVKQWIKNLLVIGAGVSVSLVGDTLGVKEITNLGVVFVSWCIASSSIYLMNDILDREKDRAHPKKRFRPIASGTVSVGLAVTLVILAMPCSLLLSFQVDSYTAGLLLAYLIVNISYCLKLKDLAQIDVLCVSSGFILRAISGAVAVGGNIDFWLLGVVTFFCMALALMKRIKEITQVGKSGETRSVLKKYSYESLIRIHDMFLVLSLLSAVMYVSRMGVQDPIMKGVGLMILTSLFFVFSSKMFHHESGDPTELFYKNKYTSALAILVVGAYLFALNLLNY